MGDQRTAIDKLSENLKKGIDRQTLIGVTGSGKTATMAWTIARANRPALVISHNKTLASQLYQEFKEFFPDNAVHYFVSYYDYYQPEAYMPVTDTYIEKDAKINDFIDQLRHASTQAALTRRDFVIVASVSCIYGIGDPKSYEKLALDITRGQKIKRNEFFEHLASLQYERNDYEKKHGTFSVKGEAVDIISPGGESVTRIEFLGDAIESIKEGGATTVKRSTLDTFDVQEKKIFPAKHFVTEQEKLDASIGNIEKELAGRLKELKNAGKILEAERLGQRTRFDIEMLEKTGYVNGIENYSRHISFRKAGEAPATLLDYIPEDAVVFIDESHVTVPQIRGMYKGDRSRKRTLVEYGFRLPSALDNRPLRFEEFNKKAGQIVFVSATPGPYELTLSGCDPKRPNTSELSEPRKEKIVEKDLSYKLQGIFFVVQRELGRFCREKQYADALENKLKEEKLQFVREYPIKIDGKVSNFADFIIENKIIIEIKTKPFIEKSDYYQVKRYLESENIELGLLINFHQKFLKAKRVLHAKFKKKDFGAFGWYLDCSDRVTEQLIRPTGLLEPEITVRPASAQIEDAKKEIQKSVAAGERVLLVTLTKRLAEDITEYLLDHGIRAEYLHSEIKTIERAKILQKLREGEFDVLVGINLLREGLDLPEVALVMILDADKEGFLRNATSLTQTVGRAARHPKGRAILYGDTVTGSMEATIKETKRRRKIQEEYNKKHGIIPRAIKKPIRKPFWLEEKKKPMESFLKEVYKEFKTPQAAKKELERQMLEAADNLQFEKAAELRDVLKTL